MPKQSHYEVLSLEPTATTDEVRRAYHQLAKQHHPDRFKDGEEKRQAEQLFAAMTDAFNVLSNPERRTAYDAELRKQAAGDAGPEAEAKNYARAATAKLNDGDYPTAVRLYKAAIHLDAKPAAYHANLAQALTKNGSISDAVRAWDEAIKRESYNGKYYRMAGQCLEKAGMHARARRMYEAAIKWNQDDPQAAEGLRRLDATAKSKKPGFLSGLFKKT